MLARNNESHLVKALFLMCPMIECGFRDLPDAQIEEWERELMAPEYTDAFWKMLSVDYEKGWAEKDP